MSCACKVNYTILLDYTRLLGCQESRQKKIYWIKSIVWCRIVRYLWEFYEFPVVVGIDVFLDSKLKGRGAVCLLPYIPDALE